MEFKKDIFAKIDENISNKQAYIYNSSIRNIFSYISKCSVSSVDGYISFIENLYANASEISSNILLLADCSVLLSKFDPLSRDYLNKLLLFVFIRNNLNVCLSDHVIKHWSKAELGKLSEVTFSEQSPDIEDKFIDAEIPLQKLSLDILNFRTANNCLKIDNTEPFFKNKRIDYIWNIADKNGEFFLKVMNSYPEAMGYCFNPFPSFNENYEFKPDIKHRISFQQIKLSDHDGFIYWSNQYKQYIFDLMLFTQYHKINIDDVIKFEAVSIASLLDSVKDKRSKFLPHYPDVILCHLESRNWHLFKNRDIWNFATSYIFRSSTAQLTSPRIGSIVNDLDYSFFACANDIALKHSDKKLKLLIRTPDTQASMLPESKNLHKYNPFLDFETYLIMD